MEQLEGNEMLQYVTYLEQNQEKLQKQLRDTNSLLRDSKVTSEKLITGDIFVTNYIFHA